MKVGFSPRALESIRYTGEGRTTVWRLLMPKTRHHIYYERDEQEHTARVVLVDNAVSADAPDL